MLAEAAALKVSLRAMHPEAFGGMWIEDGGRFVVGAVSGDAAILKSVIGAALPVPVDIRIVTYSESALDELHASIVAVGGDDFSIDGYDLAAVETDILTNRVNVVVVGDDWRAADAIKTRFGPSAYVSYAPTRSIGVACTSNANCPNPLKAGLRLYKSGSYACMSAFIMRSIASSYYLSTAGHCSNIGNVWQHPSGATIGSATHQGWSNWSPVDVALISISSGQKSNKLCAGYLCSIVSITAREDPSLGQEFIGEQTCVARKTGTACGNLVSTNNTISICRPDGECHPITDLRRSSFSVVPGDSGAPVYSLPRAIGIVSASYPGDDTDAVYSHIIHVEGYFLMSTQLTP